MTLEKWVGLFAKETREADGNTPTEFNPGTWEEYKNVLETFVKNMDEATEVYNMENKGN